MGYFDSDKATANCLLVADNGGMYIGARNMAIPVIVYILLRTCDIYYRFSFDST